MKDWWNLVRNHFSHVGRVVDRLGLVVEKEKVMSWLNYRNSTEESYAVVSVNEREVEDSKTARNLIACSPCFSNAVVSLMEMRF